MPVLCYKKHSTSVLLLLVKARQLQWLYEIKHTITIQYSQTNIRPLLNYKNAS